MAAPKLRVPRGTFDVLPRDSIARDRLHEIAATAFARAGYGRIETPAFEETELFARGVGESTDIVQKEMFSFTDQGGRELTLRPEATASICRAYVEHGMHKLAQPVKLWTWGSFFRHERPQAGRFRQFHQIDAEVIGTDDPIADAESIVLLDGILRGVGVPGIELRLGSLGSPASRAAYRDELSAHLRAHESELSDDVRARIETNPLRAFDSDHEGTRRVMAAAPTMLDRLDPADAEHFEAVKRLLDQAGVAYVLDGTLVRGLDYYTRTVFEFTSDRLGAQSALGGGGRYDGLVEELGGPATPAVGWAAGIERIMLALGEHAEVSTLDVFVAAAEGQRERAFAAVTELRAAGIRADLDLAGRSLKGQMKQAGRTGASRTIVLDEGGAVTLRETDSRGQREDDLDAILAELKGERS